MAYQALYRKWRPRTFDSVVGQEAITDTLKNAIIRNKVSHAFLFAGPRGTGKTSCAKIFAKALNCLNLQDGEPCNECENCKAADSGAMPDIIEIDAASNNGVDEIREIRDKVKYAPTQGKYKVYIIDEVHMLSIGAFNALLKTLEEPPEHVVFILATTELQKVPATIISRTQRYNFKRISKQNLVDRMKFILEQENIPYEDSALQVIAQVADGGMRDSLSILDQLLSFEKEKVEYKDALNITGYAARETTEQLFLNLLNQKVSESLDLSHKLLQDGATAKNLLSELISLATETMLVLKANKDSEFLTKDFTNQITTVPEKRYFQLITAANEALNDLRFTNQEEIPLDVFLVKVANPIE
ncbi:DNA polymerase III subunit gamma/tau, partial [Lactobacillus jensenii]